MRKVKALDIIAAAVAAVPGIALAGSDEGYTPQVLTPDKGIIRPADYRTGNTGRFRMATPSFNLTGGPEADVDATWVDLAPSFSWQDGRNWTSNPQIPDGAAAIARFGAASRGPTAFLSGATINLLQLHMSDPAFNSIYGGSAAGALNMNGPTLNAAGSNFDFPNVIFTFTAGGAGNVIGGAGTLGAAITGSAGLTKTGDTHVQLGNANTFMGPVSISGGGKLITTVGDAAFGNAANGITLNNGSIQVSTANMATTRVITMGALGGTIHNVGAGRTFIVNTGGDIAGSGTFNYNGAFGGTNVTVGTINVAASHTGPFLISGGTLSLAGANGAFLNSSSYTLNGYLLLQAGNDNRLSNTTPLSMTGSQMNVLNNETVGPMTMNGSASIFYVGPTGAGGGAATLTSGNLTRNNSATARFHGNNLGQGTAAITFANGNTFNSGGIIPWAFGNEGLLSGLAPESSRNTLVTYDNTTGVKPLARTSANYVSDPAASNAGTNLRISFEAVNDLAATPGGAAVTINSNVNANSLVINAGDSYASDTPYTIGGTGTITLTTGVILSGSSGFTAGGGINSAPGNIVNVGIDGGSNQIIIHAPSAISFNKPIHGTGGLNKAGGRTAFFNSQLSDYTGTTILSGFVRYIGNQPNGAPGPFGSSSTDIQLVSGNIVPRNPADGAANGTDTAILALDDPQVGPSTFARNLIVRGRANALLRNFSNDVANGTMTVSGNILIEPDNTLTVQAFSPNASGDPNEANSFVLSGVISGGGRLEIDTAAAAGDTQDFNRTTITGANTYSGGTDFGGIEFLKIGVDTVGTAEAITSGPFGTGSISMSGSATLLAQGGPRTVQNPLFNHNGILGLGNQITIAGPVQMVGGDGIVQVNTGETATISGNIGFGGGIFKQGAGSLILSGNNTYAGVLNVGNGTTAGGIVVADANTVTGDANSQVGVNSDATGGGNTFLIRGGRNFTADKVLVLRGNGVGAMGAVHATTGSNTWGGNVIAQAQYNGNGTPTVSLVSSHMRLGVDAGAALTINRSIFTSDPGGFNGTNPNPVITATIGVEKIGAGQLNVGSETFIATRSGGATSSFQGSIIGNGSFQISGGTVRLRSTAEALVPGVKSVFDVEGLSIAGGAKLDITDQAGAIGYEPGNTPFLTIRSLIIQGYNGGGVNAWTGNGITTSSGNANNFGIGYAEASGVLTFSGSPLDALFLGDVVDNTTVLVRFTRYGDANMDGQVNLTDFNILAGNFGLPGKFWQHGDWNYDGVINLTDFNLLAGNFGLTAGPDGPTAQDWAALAAVVPEPSSLGLLGIAGLALVRRVRRQKNS